MLIFEPILKTFESKASFFEKAGAWKR